MVEILRYVCFGMETFVRFASLLLCWATSSGAAPTDGNGSLAITGSSDAWASLVANVVPLLILIGEKNVKSYFKTISQPSQAYLYAASPIGLITAIVTAIRLGNSAFMKRLIGRQHEGRAEVLADVTSISGGTVGFELKGPRSILEQTIDPKPEDRAHFWIQGRMMGTGREALQFRDAVEAVIRNASTTGCEALGKPSAFEVPLHEPLHTTRFLKHIAFRLCGSRLPFASHAESRSDLPSVGPQHSSSIESDSIKNFRESPWLSDGAMEGTRACEATIVTVFDAAGPNATGTTRLYAAQWARCGSQKDLTTDCDQVEDSGRCKSKSLAYLNWPDVSHTLTTSVNVQVPLLYFSRLLVIAVCLSANALLIVLNWRARHDVMTTTFVSLGLLGSYSFSVWTATLVGRSTRQATVPVKNIQPFRAGFFSTNFPSGAYMAYCPKRVVMSMERNMESRDLEEGPFWYIPLFVIMSTASFLTLYLGLRAAEWWLPLAIFSNVGFATCMRAILTINSPLYGPKELNTTWSPCPLYGARSLWLLNLWGDLQMMDEYRPLSTQRTRATRLQGRVAEDTPTSEGRALAPVPTSLFDRLNFKRKETRDQLHPDQSYKHNGLLSRQEHATPETSEPLMGGWRVLTAFRYHVGSDKSEHGMVNRTVPTPHAQLVHISFIVAHAVAECHLVPHDFDFSNSSRNSYGENGQERPGLQLVRSEFVSQKGIWQQPLELAVHEVKGGLPPQRLVITLLRTWAVQAFLGVKMLSRSREFSETTESKRYADAIDSLLLHLPDGDESVDTLTMGKLWELERQALDEGFSNACKSQDCRNMPSAYAVQGKNNCPMKPHKFPVGDLNEWTARWLGEEMWSCPWMLWMGVKIILALSGPDFSKLRALQLSVHKGQRPHDPMIYWHGVDWVRDYVDFLKASGLLKPISGTPFTTQNGDQDTSTLSERGPTSQSDMSSLSPGRSSVSPDSTSCTVTNGAGIKLSDDVGYMAFG